MKADFRCVSKVLLALSLAGVFVAACVLMPSPAAAYERRLTASPAHQSQPTVWGDNVVWTDHRWDARAPGGWSDHGAIVVYNLKTGTLRRLSPSVPGDRQSAPAIYRGSVVWEDHRNGVKDEIERYDNGDIYMQDLSTGVQRQLTTNASDQVAPAIYGDTVVWTDWRNGYPGPDPYSLENSDIYAYDLVGDTESAVTTAPRDQRFPAIHGRRIVWSDERADRPGNWPWMGIDDLYTYDLWAAMESAVITKTASVQQPSVFGDIVAFEGFLTDGASDDDSVYDFPQTAIGFCNVSSGAWRWKNDRPPRQVDRSAVSPALWGTRVAYEAATKKHHPKPPGYASDPVRDIFLYDLKTKRSRDLTPDGADQTNPDYRTGRIVWEDYRHGEGGQVALGSADIYIMWPAVLSTPRLSPNPPRRNRVVAVSGTLKPRAAGAVKLYFYKRTSSGWRRDRAVYARLSHRRGYSRYEYRMLARPGRWYVKAFEWDKKNGRTWSIPRYFTVR